MSRHFKLIALFIYKLNSFHFICKHVMSIVISNHQFGMYYKKYLYIQYIHMYRCASASVLKINTIEKNYKMCPMSNCKKGKSNMYLVLINI